MSEESRPDRAAEAAERSAAGDPAGGAAAALSAALPGVRPQDLPALLEKMGSAGRERLLDALARYLVDEHQRQESLKRLRTL